MGRMTWPEAVWDDCQHQWLLHPRFGVVQARVDGSTKLRAIDDFSWSENGELAESVNGHTIPTEKLGHETLDHLAEAMALMVELTGEVPGLFKADVDSAFRRIPIRASQRWLCGIAFMVGSQVRS